MRFSGYFRWSSALLAGGALLLGAPAGARAAKRHKAVPPAPAAAPSADVLATYISPFAWGMTFEQVKNIVTQQIEDDYAPRIQEQPDIFHQDKTRALMQQAIDKFTQSYVELNGAHSDWETSIIASEIAQKDGEAMAVETQADQRKFFFFVDGKLWKVYIAFNSEKYADKTFADFQHALEARFGSNAETPVTATDSQGKTSLVEVDWPPSGRYLLRGIDQTGFYGNFCLAIEDADVARTIQARRGEANPPPPSGNALIDSVLLKNQK